MNSIVAEIDALTVSSAVYAWIGRSLVYGTLLAALTWLATRCLRGRAPSAVIAVLWCIVLVKFVAPVGPGWSASLASLCDRARALRGTVLTPSEPAENEAAEVVPPGDSPAAADVRQASVGRADGPWLLVIFYAIGVLAMGICRIRSYLLFQKTCRSLPEADTSTRELVAGVCRRLGVRRRPSPRLSDDPHAPYVTGLFRPVIALPRRLLVRPHELQTVIVHEVAHLRRGDVFVQCLQRLAGVLMFFWPVVAWVNRRIDEAREHACDEWALRHGNLSAGEYARCLLHAVQPRRGGVFAYRPAGMAAHPSNIERRIDMILNTRQGPARRRLLAVLTPVLILAWIGFALSGSATAEPPEQQVGTEKSTGVFTFVLAPDLTDAKAVTARVATYPAADVDQNGELSKDEQVAFLATAALDLSEDLVKRAPHADRNKDGELSLMEAADLLMMRFGGRRAGAMLARRSGGGGGGAVQGGTVELVEVKPAASKPKPTAEKTGDDKNDQGKKTSRGTFTLVEGGGGGGVVARSTGKRRVDPRIRHQVWILENMIDPPEAEVVAENAELIWQERLARHLKWFPGSDADGDGVLTQEEFKAHRKSLAERLPPQTLRVGGLMRRARKPVEVEGGGGESGSSTQRGVVLGGGGG